MSFGQSGGGSSQPITRGLRQGMMGFMLGHQQFTVPQLVDFGVASENASLDLLATTCNLGRRTGDTPAWRGSPTGPSAPDPNIRQHFQT